MEKQLEVKGNGQVVKFGKANFDFTPNSMQEAMDLAKILADSDLVPIAYKNKPGNILVAMNYGAELGLSGIQAVQNLAVINGKPCIYGDLGKALLLRHGCKIEDYDTPQVQKEGLAWCRVTRPDGRTMERTFTIEDAKKAGLWGKLGPWSTYPYRQMQWRAFWFVARDICADLLKGLNGAEEVQDYQVNTKPDVAMPRLKSNPVPQLEAHKDEPVENLAVSANEYFLSKSQGGGTQPPEELAVELLGAGIRGYNSKNGFSATLTLADDKTYKVFSQELAKTIKAAIETGSNGVLELKENEIVGVVVVPRETTEA